MLKKIAAMEDDLVDDPDETGALSAALKDAVSPPVLRRLSLMSRTQQAGDTSFEHPARGDQRCAMVQGYSVHANVAFKAHDRAGLDLLFTITGGLLPVFVNIWRRSRKALPLQTRACARPSPKAACRSPTTAWSDTSSSAPARAPPQLHMGFDDDWAD